MSKSIYDEALEIVNGALDLPDRSVIFNHTALTKLKKVIEKTQKQEKLLGLYKKLNELYKELITLARYNSWSWDLDSEIIDIQKQIKELESDK